MNGDLSSYRQHQRQQQQDNESDDDLSKSLDQESFVNFKHNDDFESSITLKPYSNSGDEDRFAHLIVKSRSPRSVFDHETKLIKKADSTSNGKESGYKAWMKHLSRDELKALFEAEISERKSESKNRNNNQQDKSSYQKNNKNANNKWYKNKKNQDKSSQYDEDDDVTYDNQARFHVKSDKHGHALWEHQFNKQSKNEPKIREDNFNFDVDLSKQWKDLKHKTEYKMSRPIDSLFYDDMENDNSSYNNQNKHSNKNGKSRDRRSIGSQYDTLDYISSPFEYVQEKLRQINKMDARLRSKTSYRNSDLYEIEAKLNQLYNNNYYNNYKNNQQESYRQQQLSSATKKANNLKMNAFQYSTEFEYQPQSHSHLQVITPDQSRHFARYESPSEQQQTGATVFGSFPYEQQVHKFHSKSLDKRNNEIYSFEAQFPRSFDQYDFHPFNSDYYFKNSNKQQQQRQHAASNSMMSSAAPTKILYQDKYGKKATLNMELDRSTKQKRAAIFYQDGEHGYQHSTKYGFGANVDQSNYFKTETRSNHFDSPLVSLELEAMDANQVVVRAETPLVIGELSGQRQQSGMFKQVKLTVQNQPLSASSIQQKRIYRYLIGGASSLIPEQPFYHEASLLKSEMDNLYKFNTQTTVDSRKVIDVTMDVKPNQFTIMKLQTERSSMNLKLDQESQRFDLHAEADNKNFQHNTMIQLKGATTYEPLTSNKQQGGVAVYEIQTQTQYQGRQLCQISGEIVATGTTTKLYTTSQSRASQLTGQFADGRCKVQMQYQPENKEMSIVVEDQRQGNLHEFKSYYDSSKDSVNMEYRRVNQQATRSEDKIIYQGEVRLSVRDLLNKLYSNEYSSDYNNNYLMRRSTQQSQMVPSMTSEIVFVAHPGSQQQKERVFKLKYQPEQREITLMMKDDENEFKHSTKIEYEPLKKNSELYEAIQRSNSNNFYKNLLMSKLKIDSKQESRRQPELYNYVLKADYDLENQESSLELQSTMTKVQFQTQRPSTATTTTITADDDRDSRYVRSGQLVVSTPKYQHQSKFDLDTVNKRMMITATSQNKQTSDIYYLEADLSANKRQPSIVSVRSPTNQYKFDANKTRSLYGFPGGIVQFDLANLLDDLRQQMMSYRPVVNSQQFKRAMMVQ